MVVYYFSLSESDRSWTVRVPASDPRYRVLPGRSLAIMGRKSFINHWNPTLFRELDAGRFDVVVIPGYALLSSQMAIAWAWLRRKPYLIHSESHLAEARSWPRRMAKEVFVRRVISRAAACLATGTLSKEYLCYYGARPDRVFFLPNTPDVDWFIRRSDELRPRRDELRQKWRLPKGPAVIFAGRLIQVKGVDVLIRAFVKLLDSVPDAQLMLVGDGPEEQNLRELVKRLGVEEYVHFLGFHQRDDLVELYTCADVFCLPSRHEPWGVVVNEAAACGLPLVVSDRVGAGRVIVTAGENGRVVPVEDAEALEAAIHGVLSGRESAGGWNEVSRSAARKWNYDFAQAEFRSLVEDLMEKSLHT